MRTRLFQLLSFTLLGALTSANAQTTLVFQIDQPLEPLLINAGVDQVFDGVNQVVLGGNPTASGASGGYSYAWSPEQYLDDPSAANPQLVSLDASTVFTVTVSAEGALCEKTAEVFVDYAVGIADQHDVAFHAFPNPFTNTVLFDAEREIIDVVVHDLSGSIALHQKHVQLLGGLIDVSALQAGMYFFTFMFLNGDQTTLRLCKIL